LRRGTADGDGLRAAAIGSGVVVAVGRKAGAGRRIRSADGVAWTDEITAGPDLLSLVYADGRFWAFSGSGDNTLYQSVDGKTWTTVNTMNAGANVAAGALAGGLLFVSRV